jgi:phosphoribosylanthranilate isomerase
MTPVQIKICGVTNVKDARAAAELGADMIGLNFYSQSPRYIDPEVARQIVEAMHRSVEAVGVFVDANPGEVRNIASRTGVRCVQLHGDTSPATCAELAPKFRVIRVFCTDARFHPEQASSFPDCDVLVDAHHPNLRGGTGLICHWPAARATTSFTRFLILSGGLNAQNVGQAIATVTPHAVDVCSGVESAPGVKDYRTIKNFIAAVRIADCSMSTPSPH